MNKQNESQETESCVVCDAVMRIREPLEKAVMVAIEAEEAAGHDFDPYIIAQAHVSMAGDLLTAMSVKANVTPMDSMMTTMQAAAIASTVNRALTEIAEESSAKGKPLQQGTVLMGLTMALGMTLKQMNHEAAENEQNAEDESETETPSEPNIVGDFLSRVNSSTPIIED